MKKIKQFYADHKTEIVAYTAGVATVSLIAVHYVYKTKNGLFITRADTYNSLGGTENILVIQHRNGQMTELVKEGTQK